MYHIRDLISYTWGICPWITTTCHVCFSADFLRNMLGDSININNLWLVLQSSSSEKNMVKPLTIAIFGPNSHKNGDSIAWAWATHEKMKNNYFSRNNKNRSQVAYHKLSKTFCCLKIIYTFWLSLWIFFYFVWYAFLAKKGSLN